MKALLILTLIQVNTFAASCCGGGSAIPSLITGDNEAQFSITQSYANIVGKTYSKNRNIFYSDNKSYKTLTTSIKSARLITPLLQIGLGISILHKNHREGSKKESKTHLGDSDLSLAYEFLPDTFYSKWRPRGFLYLKHTFPTGRSSHESTYKLLTDVTGRGQHLSSFGLVFTKVFKSIDWQFSGEYKNLHEAQINNIKISNSAGGSIGLNIGYSPSNGPIRMEFGVTRNHFDKKEIQINGSTQKSTREQYWDFDLNASYMINDSTFTLSYLDQTLIGSVENTTLSRKISISWLERWPL